MPWLWVREVERLELVKAFSLVNMPRILAASIACRKNPPVNSCEYIPILPGPSSLRERPLGCRRVSQGFKKQRMKTPKLSLNMFGSVVDDAFAFLDVLRQG